MNEKTPTVHAGLDLAKATLQLHLQNTHHVLDNNPAGYAALLKKLRAASPVQIICEATGGYEKGVVAALHAAAQLVSVLNPALVALGNALAFVEEPEPAGPLCPHSNR